MEQLVFTLLKLSGAFPTVIVFGFLALIKAFFLA
jgi:hypothetical protein